MPFHHQSHYDGIVSSGCIISHVLFLYIKTESTVRTSLLHSDAILRQGHSISLLI